MIMADNKEQKWEDMTLKSLEAQLRHLANVEIPKTLKTKLFVGIPVTKAVCAQKHRVLLWPKIYSFGLAAAAVVILALILIPYYSPSVSSRTLIADINDRTVHHSLVDQNNPIVDTNYISYNAPRSNLLYRE
jgi:hypothetical protein